MVFILKVSEGLAVALAGHLLFSEHEPIYFKAKS
jgi:hypothetical protein